MMEIILAIIGVSGIILAAILTYVNVRRSNDLKAIELEQAKLRADQEEEARKRREASEKHTLDMQRLAALEALVDDLRKKNFRFQAYCLQLQAHIYQGLGPPPPDFPAELFN